MAIHGCSWQFITSLSGCEARIREAMNFYIMLTLDNDTRDDAGRASPSYQQNYRGVLRRD